MGDDLWRVVDEKTEDHWLELVEPGGFWHAMVKADGCVDLRHITSGNPVDWNGEFQESVLDDATEGVDLDYLHICEVDELIERLQSLKRFAAQHFHDEDIWPMPIVDAADEVAHQSDITESMPYCREALHVLQHRYGYRLEEHQRDEGRRLELVLTEPGANPIGHLRSGIPEEREKMLTEMCMGIMGNLKAWHDNRIKG